MPGPEQDAGREQCTAERNAVDRPETGSGRACQQDLAITRRQRQPSGAEIAEGRGELARSAFAAQRRAGSDNQHLQRSVD